MAKQTKGQVYDGSQIQVLEGLEPVRKRPGMYIGSTGYDGVHHLIKEIADNCIDEAIAGYATRVEVTLLKDGGVRVADDGRGIPVDKHPIFGKRDSLAHLDCAHLGPKARQPHPYHKSLSRYDLWRGQLPRGPVRGFPRDSIERNPSSC